MILKAIAKWWAGSKLEEETAHTQALVRRLETAQAEANRRVNAKKAKYSRQIKAHQEQRNKELKQYLDFMNGQLEITGTYLHLSVLIRGCILIFAIKKSISSMKS